MPAEEGARKGMLKKKHNEEFLDLCPSPNINDQIKEDEIAWNCVMSRGEQKCLQSFGGNP